MSIPRRDWRRRSLPSDTGLPEENTLGIVVGRAGRAVSDAAKRLAAPGQARRASLGISLLGVCGAALASLQLAVAAVEFGFAWSHYAHPLLGALALLLQMAIIIVALWVSRTVGDRLPNWMFAVFLLGLAGSVALDLANVWGLGNIGEWAFAAGNAGFVLLVVMTLRGRAELIIAAVVFTVVLAVAVLIETPLTLGTISQQISRLSLVLLPPLVAVQVVEGFRRLAQTALDRVLVQSTVSAPRYAVGMLASEQLARLDLQAEELLDAVATERVSLPLSPRSASVAASLATELRLHLIEGRRETWLYHAVSESESLGKSVTLTDKSSLAGLLDPAQRDGLLSAIWLLVNDSHPGQTGPSLELQVGPVDPGMPSPSHRLRVPITIVTTGIARNRVDASVWDSLAKVGRYADSTQDSSLRVEIECLVENPAEQ